MSFTGVDKKALWVGKDLRGELKSSSPSFAAAKQGRSSECARKNNEVMKNTFCVKTVSILNELNNLLQCVAITMPSECEKLSKKREQECC